MSYPSKPKDPQAVVDFVFDWYDLDPDHYPDGIAAPYLESGETITGSAVTWTVAGDDDELIIDSHEETDTQTKVWLSGGTAGCRYLVTCHIETGNGRTDERSFYVVVRQR